MPAEINPVEVYTDCCRSVCMDLEELPDSCSHITAVLSCPEVNGPKQFLEDS